MLIVFIVSAIPVRSYTSEKFAVIAIEPKLDAGTFNLNSPRILREISWYRNNGYKIASVPGTVNDIAEVLLNPNVKALTFVGHGGTVRADGSPISSLAKLRAKDWQREIRWTLRERYKQKGMTRSEADTWAKKKSENFGLERVVNYSCWSLIDTSIAELFVKPGGVYYGSSTLYTPNPLSFILTIWGDTQFFLEEYRIPKRRTGSVNPSETIRLNPNNPSYGWKWYPEYGSWACVHFRPHGSERIITLWPQRLKEICGPHP